MTVIAYKDGVMAADSALFSVGLCTPAPFPKIARAPDGSAWGASGTKHDCWLLREWVLAGCDMDARPFFTAGGEDEISILVARPDGSLWGASSRINLAPEIGPIAYGAAGVFCEGAMRAGLSAEAAVNLAIEFCVHAGGLVQVERVCGHAP